MTSDYLSTALNCIAGGICAGLILLGSATTNHQTPEQTKPRYADVDARELYCLAKNIWHESRGESHRGRVLVAFTTLNRVASNRYPDSICAVVYQDYQFSWRHDNLPDRPNVKTAAQIKTWHEIVEIAAKTYLGMIEDNSHGALYYHAHYVSPKWANSFVQVAETAGHVFYAEPISKLPKPRPYRPIPMPRPGSVPYMVAER